MSGTRRPGAAASLGAALLVVCGCAFVLCASSFGAYSIILRAFLRPVAATGLLLGAAAGLGAAALWLSGLRPHGISGRIALSTAFGLGALSALLAFCGLLGFYTRTVALILIAIGLAALVPFARREARLLGARLAAPVESPWLLCAAMPLLAAALGIAFLVSLTPPVSYDVLEYHLAVIRDWTSTGRIGVQPHNFYSQLPFGVETLFGCGLLLEAGTDATPKLLTFGMLATVCLCIFALSKRMGASQGLAVLAAAHFACGMTVIRIYVDAFADMGAALFPIACVFSVFCWPEQGRARAIAFSGALAGFALSAKTSTAGVFLAPAALCMIAANPPAPAGRAGAFLKWAVLSCAIFGAAAAMAFSPWPIRNWLATGNPAAPFLNSWFGSDPWALKTEAFWLGMHGWAAPLSPIHLKTLGLRLDLIGIPWVLGACAAFIAGGPMARRTAATAVVGYGAYCLLTGAPDRFAAPLIALSISLTFAAAGKASRPGTLLRRSLSFFLLLSIAPALWGAVENMAGMRSIEYAGCTLSRDDFLSEHLGEPTADLFRAVNDRDLSPPAGRVLCLYDARAYLVHPDCLANTVFDRSPLLESLRDLGSDENLAARLRREGFTHILLNEYELARLIATHATEDVRAVPLYGQIASIADQRTRFEQLAKHPEWYAPYSRMNATESEIAEIEAFLQGAEPVFQADVGSLRLSLLRLR